MTRSCTTARCPAPRGAQCHCASCHRTFSSASAFDAHQTITSGLACHDPAALRRPLVPRDRHGVTVWGWPDMPREAVSARK